MAEEPKEPQNEACVLQIVGRLDASQTAAVEAELDEIIRSGRQQVQLDLARVTFLSSAGIRILMKYFVQLKKLGGTFRVVHVPAEIQSMLELSGLLPLIAAPSAMPALAKIDLAPAPVTEHRFGDVRCTAYATSPATSFDCRLIGHPDRLMAGGYDATESSTLRCTPDIIALGLGAFGKNFDDCKPRYGEFLAAAGTAAYFPTDGSNTVDFLLHHRKLVPEVQVLYALACRGTPACCCRFETETAENPAALSQLIAAGLSVMKTPRIGFVILAESAGLVGATLTRSPVRAPAPTSLFAFPELRGWFNFTSAREFDRCLTLIVGVAANEPDVRLADMMRPVGPAPFSVAHCHAAVFSFTALPQGCVEMAPLLAELFTEQQLLGLLHLLNDSREMNGAGESHFRRGIMWLGECRTEA